MKKPARIFAWRGPPLALQITGLLLGVLVVAQAVTLLLTIFFPPEPPVKYGLADIAKAIRTQADSGLERDIRTTAPAVSGRGWLSSDTSRGGLARLLGVSPSRVTLAFYTPLPFAGTIRAEAPLRQASRVETESPAASAMPVAYGRPIGASPEQAEVRPAVLLVSGGRVNPDDLLRLAQAGPGPGRPGGPPMGAPGGGFPGGGFPGGAARASPPSGPLPGFSPSAPPPSGAPSSAAPPAQAPTAAPPATAAQPPSTPPTMALPPQTLTAPAPAGPPAATLLETPELAPRTTARQEQRRTVETTAPPATAAIPSDLRAAPGIGGAGEGATALQSPPTATITQNDGRIAPASTLAAEQPIQRTGLQGAIDKARSLLGLAPAPYVEGHFVAALALPDGRWIVVQPHIGGLFTPWQKRVALWFLIAFGVTAPIGWLFARRLSRPLDRFANAAAQLGRDPSIAIAALDGPAEIGRAAHAFNLMQKRLRSFVDDRTAMVGAISHDLRTPLTRMRFRVEDAPDDIRGGMLQEVEDMEEMITSVLAFIRDASTPGARERLDLKTLLDDVAEDVAVIGANVPVEAEGSATVEVDVMGMRRVLANLVENALKYGGHARIELTISRDEAIAAIIDDGPGLPDEELEQVFQPFYRTASARASGAPGTGLGLAVCRSIARAHGGDVRLCQSDEGFRAEVHIPLVYDEVRALAA